MEHIEWPQIILVVTPHSMMRAKRAARGREEHVLVAEEFKIVDPEPAVAAVLPSVFAGSAPVPVDDVDPEASAVLDGRFEHESMLQACCVGPEQAAPPSAGNGLVQVRDCVQVTVEHVPHSDHPPSWRIDK